MTCGEKFTAVIATREQGEQDVDINACGNHTKEFIEAFQEYLKESNQSLFQLFNKPKVKKRAFEKTLSGFLKPA